MKYILFSLSIFLSIPSCKEPHEILRDRAETFESDPNEARLRKLLNTKSDASYSLLKMALVGKAFAKHPELFKLIAEEPMSDLEKNSLHRIRDLKERIFEYHPSLSPHDFDAIYEGATWLKTTE